MVITPPSRYPDLFAVLNVLISTPVFVLTWLWSIKCGVEVGWALSGPGSVAYSSPKTKTLEDVDGTTSNSIRQSGARAVSLGYAQSERRSREVTYNRRSAF